MLSLQYLWGSKAEILLAEIRDSSHQHPYVKREAFKTLKICRLAGRSEEEPHAARRPLKSVVFRTECQGE